MIVARSEKRENESAKEKAKRILFENGAYDGAFDIFSFCYHLGVSVKTYNEGEGIIKSMDLEHERKRKNGFIFSFNGKKIIFYDDGLAPKEMRFVISHELGHYLLEHSEKNWKKLKYEREANIFAHECMKLLYPDSPRTEKQNKFFYAKIISAVIILAVTPAALIPALANRPTQTPAPSNTQPMHTSAPAQNVPVSTAEPTPESDITSKIVYLTKSGNKYHESSCPHINGRTTFSMTLGEAEKSGYEACKSCMPNK